MPKKRVKLGKYKTVFKGIFFSIKHAKAEWPSGKKGVFEIVDEEDETIHFGDKNKKFIYLWLAFGSQKLICSNPSPTGFSPVKKDCRRKNLLSTYHEHFKINTGLYINTDFREGGRAT